MRIEILKSKIHRATVTDANLNYIGSMSICRKLLKASNIIPGQKIDVVNIHNGERLTTYAIEGKDGEICLNGAAARKAEIGDRVIIIAYGSIKTKKARSFKPNVVFVDENNKIIKRGHELNV